ncbi:TPA: hypothetical protein HA246_06125 [Candidatus Woesearchaeota archaeon]|nr:hypothetical protein [Candidatus Woesearchaeota archaeon]
MLDQEVELILYEEQVKLVQEKLKKPNDESIDYYVVAGLLTMATAGILGAAATYELTDKVTDYAFVKYGLAVVGGIISALAVPPIFKFGKELFSRKKKKEEKAEQKEEPKIGSVTFRYRSHEIKCTIKPEHEEAGHTFVILSNDGIVYNVRLAYFPKNDHPLETEIAFAIPNPEYMDEETFRARLNSKADEVIKKLEGIGKYRVIFGYPGPQDMFEQPVKIEQLPNSFKVCVSTINHPKSTLKISYYGEDYTHNLPNIEYVTNQVLREISVILLGR